MPALDAPRDDPPAKPAADKPRPRFSGLRAKQQQEQATTATAVDATALVPKVSRASAPRRRFTSQIPASITDDPRLQAAMGALPSNYNFEVAKTIWRLKQLGAKAVALQFPEGLLIYACAIADILEVFAEVETVIMGDVTYGACCVDDLSAAALGVDLLVHYGHSCLVPVNTMACDVMYVFVEISIDMPHLIDTVRLNFPGAGGCGGDTANGEKENGGGEASDGAAVGVVVVGGGGGHGGRGGEVAPRDARTLALCGTIQFGGALHAARAALLPHYTAVVMPQAKPLSAGEVLGCTAPAIGPEVDACVFVADGRFHPEAVLIQNPALPLYRYDPYAKSLTRERCAHARPPTLMVVCPLPPDSFSSHSGVVPPPVQVRARAHARPPPRRHRDGQGREAVGRRAGHAGAAGASTPPFPDANARPMRTPNAVHAQCPNILSVRPSLLLGQGNADVLRHVQRLLELRGLPYITVLLSEVFPAKLAAFASVEAWVQVCCPRLSIDWGHAFAAPLLSSYEAQVINPPTPGRPAPCLPAHGPTHRRCRLVMRHVGISLCTVPTHPLSVSGI